MSELKLCSYCKSVPQANTWTLHGISETRYFCPNPECPHSVRTVTLEEWQTRPIEDALNKRIAELEAEIDQLTAHDATERQDDKWIPVSERLPEDRVTILAAFNNREILTAKYYKYYEGFGSVENYWRIEGWQSGNVTHWMPIPKLPEVQE